MNRLLVRLPNWIGDAMMARPLLHALRRRFPEAARALVGPSALLELLAGEDRAAELAAWPPGGAERAALAARLRAAPIDAALVLPASFSSAWFAARTGARRRIGFAGEGRSFLLTDAPPRPPRGEFHLSEEYFSLGRPLGAEAVELPRLTPGDGARERAAALLRSAGGPETDYVVFAPGASYGPAKRWAPERFARVADACVRAGRGAVLCGGGTDAGACRAVAAAMREPSWDLAGRTSLPELAALCAGAAAVVSNDSGLAHVAAATGAGTVVIFGSTSSAWTAPLGARVTVVQSAPVCAPCFRPTCAIGYRCLEAVTVERVERACMEAAA